MVPVLLLLIALQANPSATQITGTWAGTLAYTHDNQKHEDHLHIVLKQDGQSLTGTGGPDADRQYKLSKGKVTVAKGGGTVVTFELNVDSTLTSFDLKLVGGVPATLTGRATFEGEDGIRHSGTVELKPVK